MKDTPDVVITLTTGKQDRGTRATLAFSWGCAALAMGKEVTMYLTMEGTVWAAEGSAKGVEVGGFESLNSYIDQFFGLGGKLLVCAPCSEYYCSIEQSKIQSSMISNAQLTGLATVVSIIGDNTKMVTF